MLRIPVLFTFNLNKRMPVNIKELLKLGKRDWREIAGILVKSLSSDQSMSEFFVDEKLVLKNRLNKSTYQINPIAIG